MSSPESAVTPLTLGEIVCIIGQDGKVLTGRIARADRLHRADGTPGPWTLFMTPLEDEAGR
jgi:hypothetical protein